jgi:hypothetical protein
MSLVVCDSDAICSRRQSLTQTRHADFGAGLCGLGGVSMSIKRSSPESDQGTDCSTAVPSPDSVLDQIRLAIKGIRYGEIRVIIQDHVIVQIERVEKQRLR